MQKLNKKHIRSLIIQEVSYQKSRMILESNKTKIKNYRNKLLDQGHDQVRVDENIISMLSGIGQRAMGLGAAEFASPGESESIFGGLSDGMRVAVEQTILEALVKKMGLDPYSGFGLTLKNAFERVLKNYSNNELSNLLSGGQDCNDTAFKIAREVIVIVEESEKERVLSFAMNSIGGQFGADFKQSPLTKGIYQNIREKFSEAFDDLIDEDAMAESLATTICDTFSMDSVLGFVKDSAGEAIDTTFGEFAGALSNINPF